MTIGIQDLERDHEHRFTWLGLWCKPAGAWHPGMVYGCEHCNRTVCVWLTVGPMAFMRLLRG